MRSSELTKVARMRGVRYEPWTWRCVCISRRATTADSISQGQMDSLAARLYETDTAATAGVNRRCPATRDPRKF